MLEFLLCSSVTILPDYLFRRFAQGKRWGHELTAFSMWYELRWGITACLMLTLTLITTIFYFHPSTTNVTSFFRTVTIVSEKVGRVAEVHVRTGQEVAAGDLIFTLDSSSEEAAVEAAMRKVAEVSARAEVSKQNLAAARGRVESAEGSLTQAVEELAVRQALAERGGDSIISQRELDRLANIVDAREGALHAAEAEAAAALALIETQIPAERASAEAALHQAEAELAKTVIVAGTSGTVTQFALQPGDISNPVLRPAGILVPTAASEGYFAAGFDQISAQVIRPGMIAEITCASKPFTIVPMVVTQVQDVIASGQFRPSDRLIDPSERTGQPGTITAQMEPLYEGQADGIPPGSNCITNAYTSHHELIASGELSFFGALYYHAIDAVGLIHAFILRAQAILLPVRTLVLSGH